MVDHCQYKRLQNDEDDDDHNLNVSHQHKHNHLLLVVAFEQLLFDVLVVHK